MLAERVILFDDECPMCRVYTAGFVRAGALPAVGGRCGLSERGAARHVARIDRDRARHEIPLLDTRTGEVAYGLDALFLLIGEAAPALRPLLRRGGPLLRTLLRPPYAYVSYNRRVIAGCQPKAAAAGAFDAAPDLHRGWRTFHLALCSGLWALFTFWASGDSVLATALAAVLLGLCLLALGVLPRSCGAWDRTGSLATCAATGALLLCAGASLPAPAAPLGIIGASLAALLDLRRRLLPRCGAAPGAPRGERGRVPLPMARDAAAEGDSVLRCLRCREGRR